MTERIVYNGDFQDGQLVDPRTGLAFHFTRGEPIEVPEGLLALLAGQPDWSAAPAEPQP